MRRGWRRSGAASFPPASQPLVEARFVAVLHPGIRRAHALCWPIPPFSWREPPPPPRLELLCFLSARPSAADTVGRVRRVPRLQGVPREGAGPPFPPRVPRGRGRWLWSGAARPLHGRRGSWKSSKGNGERVPAFSRLNLTLYEVETKRYGHTSCFLLRFPAGEAPGLLPRGQVGWIWLVRLHGGVLRAFWLPWERRGDEKMDSVEATGLGT